LCVSCVFVCLFSLYDYLVINLLLEMMLQNTQFSFFNLLFNYLYVCCMFVCVVVVVVVVVIYTIRHTSRHSPLTWPFQAYCSTLAALGWLHRKIGINCSSISFFNVCHVGWEKTKINNKSHKILGSSMYIYKFTNT